MRRKQEGTRGAAAGRGRPGAVRTIQIVLPSGRPPAGALEAGVAWLAERGFPVRLPHPDTPAAPQAFLAATDLARAEGLAFALAADDVDLVWCGRGGTGSLRTLAALDRLDRHLDGHRDADTAPGGGRREAAPPPLAAHPQRPLMGLSDATPLLLSRLAAGGTAVHGPVVTMLPRLDAASADALIAWLDDPGVYPALPASHGAPRLGSSVRGPLVAGNLAMLAASCGTPEQPVLDGAILLVEDINEPDWRLDRFCAQLHRSGALAGLRGLAIGDFDAASPDGPSEAVLLDWAARLGVPALCGLPVGHGARCFPVLLGATYLLDVPGGELTPVLGGRA